MIHNVLIFSYNRPRMVKEAVKSVLESDADILCWVYDDGSDFDIEENLKDIESERLIIAAAPRVTPEERVRRWNTRWPTNVNWILSKMPKGQTITYLCDDDIIDRRWLSYVDKAFSESPSLHMVVGDMYYFYDGQNPYTESKEGFPAKIQKDDGGFLIWWNLGAFTVRTDCFYDCNAKWRDGHKGYPHSWDIKYIDSLLLAHPGYVKIPVPAMYRREHDNTLSARAGRIVDGFYVNAAEEISPEHVSGFME